MHKFRRGARLAGIEVERATPATQWRLRLPVLLSRQAIDCVLDVGANDGGFATDLLEHGYKGRVLSFEPLPDAWSKLTQRMQRFPQWSAAPRLALSNHDGEAVFHEAGNSVSSSLLEMTRAHTDAAASSVKLREHRVTTRRLDEVLPALTSSENIYLKLDVQGAEKMVLEGAAESLRGPIKGLQMEMSLASLYDGQALASELHEAVQEYGFELWDIVPGFRDPHTHRLLQYDGIYFKRR